MSNKNKKFDFDEANKRIEDYVDSEEGQNRTKRILEAVAANQRYQKDIDTWRRYVRPIFSVSLFVVLLLLYAEFGLGLN